MIVYRTINRVNGRMYIGMDSRNNPTYLGSGKALKCAINKYGKNNFIKEILEVCSNREELARQEIYWIKHYNAVDSPLYYNIKRGGIGGWEHVDSSGAANPMYGKTVEEVWLAKYGKEKTKELCENRSKLISKSQKNKVCSPFTKEHKEKISKSRKEYYKNLSAEQLEKVINAFINLDKKYERTEEHKQKMSQIKKGVIQPMATCIFCGKYFTKANIVRWHNENCRHKQDE